MYGIEFFKHRMGSHQVCMANILDGKIGDNEPLFNTNKKGFGTFIDEYKLDKTGQIKWNKSISDKSLKLEKFAVTNFADACTVFILCVLQYLL